MKNKKLLISIILSIVVICFLIYTYYLNNKINNYREQIKELKNISNNDIIEIEKNIEHEYNCSFTETWRIVNTLDNYIAEVPELSYIVVDKFQSHSAYSYYIPSVLKTNLEENKYYEFTYNLKGTGIINDMEDIYSYMIKTATNNESKIKVTLTIKETDKKGLEQLNEPICK